MALTQVQGGMILPSTTLTTPIVATTMGVGGATPSTSGSGITFPATQSASTDANTLDDYEEGTFTPSIIFNGSASSGQTGTFVGFYTKTGNQVFATFLINLSNKGSGTGSMGIGGLPFSSKNDSNYRAVTSSMYWDAMNQSYVYLMGLMGGNSAAMEVLGATASSTTLANPQASNVSNTANFRFSVTYQV